MKTLDKVIEELQYWDTCHEYPECFYDDEVTRDALHYLKEFKKYQNTPSRNGHMTLVDYFEESQKNEPLTWDELKLMEGSPVWVETKYYSSRWAVITDVDDVRIRFVGKQLLDSEIVQEMGETWQAYRKEKQ